MLMPKVESADTVRQVAALMEANGAPDDMAIWCMIESPRGVLHAEEIADASPRMGALIMGTADLGKELHAADTLDRIPFLTSLQLCVLAARAASISILDAVYFDLNDDEGFAQSCKLGKDLGFDGKTLIHPKPSPKRIKHLRRAKKKSPGRKNHGGTRRGAQGRQGYCASRWEAHRKSSCYCRATHGCDGRCH